MEGVAAEGGVILLHLHLLLLNLLITRGHVARRAFTFLAGFRTLENDDFAGHSRSRVKVWGIGVSGSRAREKVGNLGKRPILRVVRQKLGPQMV